ASAGPRACAKALPGSRPCSSSAPGRPSARRTATYRAQFHQLSRRRGPQKAICAVAAAILTAIYHMLKDGTVHHDLGANHFDRRPTQVRVKHLIARLAKLGYQVQLQPLMTEFLVSGAKQSRAARCSPGRDCFVARSAPRNDSEPISSKSARQRYGWITVAVRLMMKASWRSRKSATTSVNASGRSVLTACPAS
ncbi:MAG: transposase, partial [Chloroflexota bacterium]|nr:transposase [Chloroflexota bacterium]